MPNLGSVDRGLRVAVALALLIAAALAPAGLLVRVAALAVPGLYLLGTALAGTCVGYALLGRSTCPRR